MGPHRRLVLSDAGSQAAPGVTMSGAAAIPAIGESVRYRARDENAGVLRAKAAEAGKSIGGGPLLSGARRVI